MEYFLTSLFAVLLTLFYMIPGFVLKKTKLANPDHLPTLSTLLIYAGTPFIEVNAFLSLGERDFGKIGQMFIFFVVSFMIQVAFAGILALIMRKKLKETKIRMLMMIAMMGNVGFFGIPLMEAMFPGDAMVLCYTTMYIVSLNVIVFTLATYLASGEKKYMSFKAAVLNPSTIAFAVAFALYLLNAGEFLPAFIKNGIKSFSGIAAPLCMVILGIRLATIKFKEFFQNKEAIIGAVLKMVVFPLFVYAIIILFPFDVTFKKTLVILSGTPAATAVLSLAEIHKVEQKEAANGLLLSTLVSFITIPLLTMLPYSF